MTIIRDINVLHREMIGPTKALAEDLIRSYQTGVTQFEFQVFETVRSAARQDELFAKGTTKLRGGHGPHQVGLAVDFVPYRHVIHEVKGISREAVGWTWDVPGIAWRFLHDRAARYGLVCPIKWDPGHVEFPNWRNVKP